MGKKKWQADAHQVKFSVNINNQLPMDRWSLGQTDKNEKQLTSCVKEGLFHEAWAKQDYPV